MSKVEGGSQTTHYSSINPHKKVRSVLLRFQPTLKKLKNPIASNIRGLYKCFKKHVHCNKKGSNEYP